MPTVEKQRVPLPVINNPRNPAHHRLHRPLASSAQYRNAFPKQYGSSMSSRSGLQATPPTPAMPAPPGPIETVIEIIPPRGGWSPASGDCSSTTHSLAVSVRAVTKPKSMPSVRRAITASSNSIPRMSGTRVPAGITDAGGEANDSPGSGPLSDGDLDAWMSMRLPVSTGLWRAGEVDVSDEQATVDIPRATATATTCKCGCKPDKSEGRHIRRPSSLGRQCDLNARSPGRQLEPSEPILDPMARDTLRRVLIHDQADRDAISSQLLRYRERARQRLGRHHRHADAGFGGATASGASARRVRGVVIPQHSPAPCAKGDNGVLRPQLGQPVSAGRHDWTRPDNTRRYVRFWVEGLVPPNGACGCKSHLRHHLWTRLRSWPRCGRPGRSRQNCLSRRPPIRQRPGPSKTRPTPT
jgi:hypothetical protein